MKSLVSEFMSKNKVLVSYVRDAYGFRKGVVVALDKDKFGFSLVNKAIDVQWKRMKPYQLPRLQRLVQLGVGIEEIVGTEAYRKCVAADHMVRVPMFNKREGLQRAIDSALNGEITYKDGMMTMANRVPMDSDFVKVLEATRVRAENYFKVSEIPF
jgi:hypothetical protein